MAFASLIQNSFLGSRKILPRLSPYHYVCLLFVIGICFRIVYWFYYGMHSVTFPENDSSYYFALSEHFIDYVYHAHTKPIGSHLRDFISLTYFGNITLGNFILTSVSSVISSVMIYLLLKTLRLGNGTAFFSGLLFSLGIIGWEYWRTASHFDHLNVFLFTMMIWTMGLHLKKSTLITAAMLSVSGGLLVLFHSMAVILVPIICIASQRFSRRFRNLLLLTIVSLAIPLILISFTVGKNYYQFEILGTSSVMGQNMLQYASLGKLEQLEGLIDAGSYPEWWEWCFRNGSSVINGRPLSDAIYGKCIYKDRGIPIAGYDFTGLEKYLNEKKEMELLKTIEQDRSDVISKPWLFTGGIWESSTRFSIEYGKISSLVWWDWIRQRPVEFFGRFVGSSVRFGSGVLFLGTDIYEPQLMPRHIVARITGLAFAPVLAVGFISSLYLPVSVICKYFRTNSARNYVSPIYWRDYFLVLMVCNFWLIMIMTNMLTCCENSRMFMNVIVLPYILGIVFLQKGLNLLRGSV